MKRIFSLFLTGLLISCLTLLSFTGVASAQVRELTPTTPQELPDPSPYTNSFWDKLDRLREDRQLQELIEKDLDRSFTIRSQIQTEVDRAFSHTTTLLNVLLALLTFLPVLAAASVWFIRRSVINQLVNETKQQMREEVEKQLEKEVAAEIKQQTEAFKQEVENLRVEFQSQLSQLKSFFSDVQREKDSIIQELAEVTPSLIRESAPTEIQEKIHRLTQKLESLASQSQLTFTPSDYIEQGKALYFEGRFEEAIALYDLAIQQEPDNAKAWFGKGAALSKQQQIDSALAAYEKALQLKPDFSEAWFGKGTLYAKLQQPDTAISAYDRAIELKPDFFLAWFSKARSHAVKGENDTAISSLQHAIQLNPEKAKEVAKTDACFEGLRDRPDFQTLVL